MKYVLIKYKHIKLLINEGLEMQPLINHLSEIEALEKKVSVFYKNVMTAKKGEGESLQKEADAIISKIGYRITGVPFTLHEAELYALDKKLDYEILELHGNTGNEHAGGDLPANTQLQIRLNSTVKSRYVNQAQAEGLSLSQWVIKTLDAAIAK